MITVFNPTRRATPLAPTPASSTAASTAAADHQHHDPVAAATAGAQDALAKGPQALLDFAAAQLELPAF